MSITVDTTGFRRKVQEFLDRIDEHDLLELIGQDHLAWVDKNFREAGAEQKWKPLSPNTIAQRRGGSDRPLMDTGRLRQSFVSNVKRGEVVVGTSNKLAPFHHHGTDPYTIVPKRGRSLRFKSASGVVYTKQVNHPGLPARPLLPTKALAERIALQSVEAAIRGSG